jgi:hypothetical protein
MSEQTEQAIRRPTTIGEGWRSFLAEVVQPDGDPQLSSYAYYAGADTMRIMMLRALEEARDATKDDGEDTADVARLIERIDGWRAEVDAFVATLEDQLGQQTAPGPVVPSSGCSPTPTPSEF